MHRSKFRHLPICATVVATAWLFISCESSPSSTSLQATIESIESDLAQKGWLRPRHLTPQWNEAIWIVPVVVGNDGRIMAIVLVSASSGKVLDHKISLSEL